MRKGGDENVGEWFLDPSTRVLDFWPPKTVTGADVYAPTTDDLTGTQPVAGSAEGEGCSWMAVRIVEWPGTTSPTSATSVFRLAGTSLPPRPQRFAEEPAGTRPETGARWIVLEGLNHYQGPMWDAWQKQSLEWLARNGFTQAK